ncbi:anti-sigma regulatory factor (Ser/Thr protein kinase) [Streptomyces echinatus]|uniref:Anti-sigma regulatory factor (Ser/Thr protein kinase) n=1 Tax=Streptomyces echinatus TaxID=67293 RepID=A0A7W9UU86_9ACTN|nr:anti-sigma regulatory factor (Ser/Thr protein kinase) [Streptomyces echinatus]
MGERAVPQGGAAEHRFRFELAAHPGSVARARNLARARLSGWSVCADTCDNAALVVSELVTNAIVHTASSRVVCELHDHDGMVRIAVRDEGCAPGEPHPSPQRPDEEHGRGLLLVDALCRAWGAQEHGPGLLVWAELPRRTEAAGDTGEARCDLGWGARPKPGRPVDSDEDQSAEASGRSPEQHRHGAVERHRSTRPEQHSHPAHAEQQPHSAHAEQHPHAALPQQHRHAAHPEQHPHATPTEQHRHVTRPEQHRHTAPERHPYRAPEQRPRGERA